MKKQFEKQQVRETALACGFKLKPQPDGSMDLDPYIYTFAEQLMCKVRVSCEIDNMDRAEMLSYALGRLCIYNQDFAHNDMNLMQVLYVLQAIRDELSDTAQSYLDTYFKNMQEISTTQSTSSPDTPPDTPPVNDPVNHPSHYTDHPSGIEAIEVTRHMGFNVGNAIKYLWRNGKKEGQPAIQDLEKAIWYIQDEINRLK